MPTNPATKPLPEHTFFEDPATDRLFGVVMALATEVWVLKDRVAAMEAQLADKDVLDMAALDAEPDLEARAASKAERDRFVAHLLDNLKGEQASQGLPGDGSRELSA